MNHKFYLFPPIRGGLINSMIYVSNFQPICFIQILFNFLSIIKIFQNFLQFVKTMKLLELGGSYIVFDI